MRRLVIASIVFMSAALFAVPFASAAVHPTVRIKELAHVEGVRSNQLTGLGLVVGLQGTGDRSQLALRMMRNMVTSFGISTDEKMIRSRNAAVVTATAQLSPFVRQGQTVDVVVSAMGDAKSLEGGVLLQTPCRPPTAKFMPWRRDQSPWAVSSRAVPLRGSRKCDYDRPHPWRCHSRARCLYGFRPKQLDLAAP